MQNVSDPWHISFGVSTEYLYVFQGTVLRDGGLLVVVVTYVLITHSVSSGGVKNAHPVLMSMSLTK